MSGKPFLVLGVGNELFTDEGIGVAAVKRLAERTGELDMVDIVDGATLGLALAAEIADREGLILLDAIASAKSSPGDVITLIGDEVPYTRSIQFSAHQVGVSDALAATSFAGNGPRRVAAIGMVPVSLDTGFGISPEAENALDQIVDRALELLADWGAIERVAADA